MARQTKLAVLGGQPALSEPLSRYKAIGENERAAVDEVMLSGVLSGFYGSWQDGFRGGPKVRAFEAAWCERFGAAHSVSVNSNTSGLYASMGAVGVSPGDEVIVPATTMSATAMAPLIYGGIPVFADLDPDTFCLSVESVKANLTEKTRAVLAVNLFGHPAPLHDLRALCDDRGIFLIEDNAQAILASEHSRMCGTIGHIGVFSLNYHKHINTGEGGMCTTDDPQLAERLSMIRNHAEAVAEPAGAKDLVNLVGFNFRMTELSAAVGLAQLSDLERHVEGRRSIAGHLSAELVDMPGLRVPLVREGCTHSYYLWALRFDAATVGVSRAAFAQALNAEGFPCFEGYVQPLYFLPLFRERVAIGRDGFPFSLSERRYQAGLCPVAEHLYEDELIWFETCAYDLDATDLRALVAAFRKVYEHRGELAADGGARRGRDR